MTTTLAIGFMISSDKSLLIMDSKERHPERDRYMQLFDLQKDELLKKKHREACQQKKI
jgi:hypothetical protein